jgi:ribonuclease BN (tRNA processing enzyme)
MSTLEDNLLKLRVLGCSGAELPGHNPPSFLLDDCLLLDAGTVGSVLDEDEQWRVTDILITHSHLDHVRGIPALADNIAVAGVAKNVKLFSTAEVLTILRTHLMNGMIWPDFSKIPDEKNPVISYEEIIPEREFLVGEFTVCACLVDHTVPAVGYLITKGASTLLYTGDTGPTERIWKLAGKVSALIIEVSFPDQMEEMALLTGHLTPLLLKRELEKLKELPPRILITHLKPQYSDLIQSELDLLEIPGIELLAEGKIYQV